MTALASAWRRPTRWSTETRVRALLGLGIAAHVIFTVISLIVRDGHDGDFARYWELATGPGRAYADFAVEYPPGALIAFSALARVTGELTVFSATFILINAAADAAIVTLLASQWGNAAAAVYAWSVLPTLSLLFFRYDLWPLACALGAVVLWRRRWFAGCVVAIALGVALKLWPFTFAVLLLGNREHRASRAPLVWLGSILAVGLVGWIAYGGIAGPIDVVTFRQATGWHIESTIGSIWRALDPDSIRPEAGTLRAGRSLPLLSAALFAITLPAALWALSRGVQLGRLGTGWVAAIGLMLVTSALLSPQFLGWLLPGAAIAWAQGDRRTAKGIAAAVALTIAYRLLHTRQVPELVICRNALLIAVVVQALASLAAQSRQHRSILRFEAEHGPHG